MHIEILLHDFHSGGFYTNESGCCGHAMIGITAERYLQVYSDGDADAAEGFGRLVG